MSVPKISVTSARVLVVLVISVAVSFIIATVVSQYRATSIEHKVNDIIGNAIPSVQSLSRARSALRHEINELETIAHSSSLDLEFERQKVQTFRQDLEAEFQTYFSLPYFHREKEMAEKVKDQEHPFDASVDDYFTFIKLKDRTRAMNQLRKCHSLGAFLDDGLARLLEFNSGEGQRLGLEISNVRAQTLGLAAILDLISVALAIFASIMTVRIMRQSFREVEERAQELELFAERVAHDLRGPLAGILMRAESGQRFEEAEQIKKSLSQIKKTGDRMQRLIDGLLAFARSGAHPSPQSVDLSTVIEDVVSTLRQEAADQGAKIIVEGIETPAIVACQTGALTSVVSNLLRNAVKFIADSKGPIREIKVRAKKISNFMHVEIEDTGPGIEAEKQKLIFQPYVRASSNRPGLGIGLATVKRIIESYNGTLGVRSTLGIGSCFWFELPISSSLKTQPT